MRIHLPRWRSTPTRTLPGPLVGVLFSAGGMGRASTPNPGRLRDRTSQVFGPRSERSLSEEDAREIGENLVGYFRLLGEWARASDLREMRGALTMAAVDPADQTEK
jgi:hypothetical protein